MEGNSAYPDLTPGEAAILSLSISLSSLPLHIFPCPTQSTVLVTFSLHVLPGIQLYFLPFTSVSYPSNLHSPRFPARHPQVTLLSPVQCSNPRMPGEWKGGTIVTEGSLASVPTKPWETMSIFTKASLTSISKGCRKVAATLRQGSFQFITWEKGMATARNQ